MTNQERDRLIKLAIYFLCVWISTKFADGYAVVGPVFGLAVVAYDSKFFTNISREKHVGFLIASTLIYALVYWMSLRKWESSFEFFNYLIGPFALGVVLGSVLLPYAHKMFFKKSPVLTKQVIAFLLISFYTVTFFAYVYNEFGIGFSFNYAAIAIALWQGIYLYLFFRSSAASSKRSS